jgi:SAM-dependent methyltransferase
LPADAPVLPPGTILQTIYVRKRLRARSPGSFVEVGVGSGVLSRLLLELGWTGVGWDLNENALAVTARLSAVAIAEGKYEVRLGDWLSATDGTRADLVLSSMVLEHLDDEDERRYFERASEVLTDDGLAVLVVPASPRHWGIEDEIAGHHRRYSFESLARTIESAGWSVVHMAGLTFPLSNLLLRLSNRQVRRWEGEKTNLELKQRTVMSGHRAVPWKTSFPPAARLVLNERVLLPFHVLQQAFRRNENALVLYCECRPRAKRSGPD